MLKKEILKNAMIVAIILLIAIVSTYHIYYKFQNSRNVDFNSESLDVVYHDATDKIQITKVTPVTDSVGLSGKAFDLSIKNNLTIEVPYKIKIVPDKDYVLEDGCFDKQIPEDQIRVSIKTGKKNNKIYTLSELEDGVLLDTNLGALKMDEIVIRLWISKDTTLPAGADMHYHGMIQVIEEDNVLAIR